MSPKNFFCFGYGYSAAFLGETLRERGWTLSGTTRSMSKRALLQEHGITPYIFDKEKPLPDPAMIFEDVTHLLISTPPDREGDIVFESHADDIVRMMPKLEWVGYLSTTGVYGDRDGALVDEESDIQPTAIRGTRRAMAEQQWLSLFQTYGTPVHIFRLAGIYGPGRSAIDSVRVGIARRIMKAGHAFCRVHVDDIVATLLASIDHPHPGSIYNVADDEPAPSHEVIAYAARLLGKDPPPLVRFEDANLAPITLSFYSDNKRVSNSKIKTDLGVHLIYPSYRAGLEACLVTDRAVSAAEKHPLWSLLQGHNDPAGGGF
ncbi:MAG: SDR family oxidoreductase [Pseudobdellovibrionaceae bacterium]